MFKISYQNYYTSQHSFTKVTDPGITLTVLFCFIDAHVFNS